MSYKVKIRQAADTGNGISVEAKVNGEPVAHTFPKGAGYFDESGAGKPAYVKKLEEKYEQKMRRKGKTAQTALTSEEKKVHSGEILNKTYGEAENFKQANNEDSSMENVDFENPENIRNYLKNNMAEGYLSQEEENRIDEFVDRYEQLMSEGDDKNTDYQDVVRRAFEVKVQ